MMSPEQMTVDPVFDFDGTLSDVSNIHNLSGFDPTRVWDCPDLPATLTPSE